MRWLRWSTVFAILFYMFFIGVILHSTTYKLQHSLKNNQQHRHGHHSSEDSQQQPDQMPENQHIYQHRLSQTQSRHNDEEFASLYEDLKSATHQAGGGGGSSNVLTDTLTRSAVMPVPAEAASLASSSLSTASKQEKKGTSASAASSSVASPETVILVASSANEKHILEKAFKRADRNHDNYLTIKELGQYINKNIVDHIDEAIQLNPREFRRVDISPADGLVTWEEYHRYFLKEHGMTEADIDEHNEIKHTALNRKAREDMMRDKARWSEAARTDLFTLTIDEYLSFRHPESSISNLLELVDDLLRQFDQDGDDQLSIEEFSEVNVADDDDLIRKSLISKTVVERREEFKRIIDKNQDGKADRGELLNYVNPKTPRYALQEAATLFSLCDEDRNGKLTLKEILSNAEIFLTSKMIDTAQSFHTEF
ncbi:45 kDa calcium-binding protein [Musca vetustissima]|uniref:45 kDa calcium-binding protein n=1 Tax=Musca vetustissima TaxID=27455 RepID=UPI002AB644F2|nr:45 kDa calcium-binding protein [Musca vetustissima]